jgi:hypothetical protein
MRHFWLQKLANELIERQTNPTLRSRMASALQSLTSANQLSSTLDRMNYQRFRKNVNNFLIEVRGFLRTIWFVAPHCKCKQNILVFLILCIVFTWTRFWNRKENPSSNAQYSQFLVVSRVKLKLFVMNEIEVETLVQVQGSENDGFTFPVLFQFPAVPRKSPIAWITQNLSLCANTKLGVLPCISILVTSTRACATLHIHPSYKH